MREPLYFNGIRIKRNASEHLARYHKKKKKDIDRMFEGYTFENKTT
jgi:hypothetical protein